MHRYNLRKRTENAVTSSETSPGFSASSSGSTSGFRTSLTPRIIIPLCNATRPGPYSLATGGLVLKTKMADGLYMSGTIKTTEIVNGFCSPVT